MDQHILIALVGAILNMILSSIVPCLIKKTEQPFLTQVKKVFETNRQVILTSSLIVAVTIYLALKVTPEVNETLSDMFDLNLNTSLGPSDIMSLGTSDVMSSRPFDFTRMPMVVSVNQLPAQLRNLVKLMD
jgi:phosphotransferase system  glucose/maltose/N-acetylglucosamine-specific IIC component